MMAEGYFQAKTILNDESTRIFEAHASDPATANTPAKNGLVLPTAVCGAFCVELYLKCLETLDWNRNPKPGHNLETLFGRLKPATQQLAEKYFDELASLDPMWAPVFALAKAQREDLQPNLRSILKACATAFEKIRYSYEGIGSSYHLGSFEDALRRVILERRRDWAPLAYPPPWYTTHIPSSVNEKTMRRTESKPGGQ
jgi:hypothetical protein